MLYQFRRWISLPCLIVLGAALMAQAAPPGLVDTPKAAVVAKATPPQSILDALTAVENDRQALAASDAAIAQAQKTLSDATQLKAAATAAMSADQASFLQLWSTIYGPVPAPIPPPAPAPPTPPQPPAPPVPPVPPVPVPPVVQTTLTVITATGGWCQACTALKADTLPALQNSLGDRLKVVDYADPIAAKVYPESALVPRWTLTRPDGKTEKKIGYQSIDQINTWIGGAAK